jgi:hypothetical protein
MSLQGLRYRLQSFVFCEFERAAGESGGDEFAGTGKSPAPVNRIGYLPNASKMYYCTFSVYGIPEFTILFTKLST